MGIIVEPERFAEMQAALKAADALAEAVAKIGRLPSSDGRQRRLITKALNAADTYREARGNGPDRPA